MSILRDACTIIIYLLLSQLDLTPPKPALLDSPIVIDTLSWLASVLTTNKLLNPLAEDHGFGLIARFIRLPLGPVSPPASDGIRITLVANETGDISVQRARDFFLRLRQRPHGRSKRLIAHVVRVGSAADDRGGQGPMVQEDRSSLR